MGPAALTCGRAGPALQQGSLVGCPKPPAPFCARIRPILAAARLSAGSQSRPALFQAAALAHPIDWAPGPRHLGGDSSGLVGGVTEQLPAHRQNHHHAHHGGGPAARVRAHFSVRYGGAARPRIAGDAPALGAWQPAGAVQMEPCGGDLWVAAVDLPAGATVQYKYVLVDGAGRAVQWQEGPNLALDLPQDPTASVARADAWSAGAAAATTATTAAAMQAPTQQQLHAAPLPRPPAAAGGGGPPAPPGSPSGGVRGAIAPAAARAALPSLRHQLEAALAALSEGAAPASLSSGGPQGGAAAPDAESVGAAVQGLRALQAIALEDQGGAAPRPGDVESLRRAFSPSAGDEDAAVVDAGDADAANAMHAAVAAALRYDGCGGAGGGGGVAAASSDPLVAALLSDDCDVCCAFLHDALCGSGGAVAASGAGSGGAPLAPSAC